MVVLATCLEFCYWKWTCNATIRKESQVQVWKGYWSCYEKINNPSRKKCLHSWEVCMVKSILKFRRWEHVPAPETVRSTSNNWPTALEANDQDCIRPTVCCWSLYREYIRYHFNELQFSYRWASVSLSPYWPRHACSVLWAGMAGIWVPRLQDWDTILMMWRSTVVKKYNSTS